MDGIVKAIISGISLSVIGFCIVVLSLKHPEEKESVKVYKTEVNDAYINKTKINIQNTKEDKEQTEVSKDNTMDYIRFEKTIDELIEITQ